MSDGYYRCLLKEEAPVADSKFESWISIPIENDDMKLENADKDFEHQVRAIDKCDCDPNVKKQWFRLICYNDISSGNLFMFICDPCYYKRGFIDVVPPTGSSLGNYDTITLESSKVKDNDGKLVTYDLMSKHGGLKPTRPSHHPDNPTDCTCDTDPNCHHGCKDVPSGNDDPPEGNSNSGGGLNTNHLIAIGVTMFVLASLYITLKSYLKRKETKNSV